jgi:hypothetical protein
MKKTPEQEAVEEGAVGGGNNIETARPIPRKYKIDRDALYNSSREINRIQEEIFRSNTFRRLGILDSSSRSYYLGEFN